MEYVTLACRFILASVFVVAALNKLPRLSEFEQAVRQYDVLPARLITPIARALPPFELVCGLLLAVGLAQQVAASLLALALLAFAVAVAVNLGRGREIHCGCFSSAIPRRITWATVVRNAGLAAAAAVVVAYAPTSLALDSFILAKDATAVSSGMQSPS